MKLTDIKCRKAVPMEKLYKLTDGGGLHLRVLPNGAKYWYMDYRYNGRQKSISFGVYPSVSLVSARQKREEAKKLIAENIDPGLARKQEEEIKTITFAKVAGDYMAKKEAEGRSEATLEKNRYLLKQVMPAIGELPITSITAPIILKALKPIEARKLLETANKTKQIIGSVIRLAMASGIVNGDPTVALHGALASPQTKNRAAIIEPVAFGGLLRALWGYEGRPETVAALKLSALTMVRPGELRHAEWPEIDLEKAIWTIPASKMKMRIAHKVPLSPQVLEVLHEMHNLTGGGKYVFAGGRSVLRPMSENTVGAALRNLGYSKDQMTAHGFRASAASMLNECGKWSSDAIERQLAHKDTNAIRAVYARAEYWDERVKMLNWWADECDRMRRGATVLVGNFGKVG